MNAFLPRGRPAKRRNQVLSYVQDCLAADGIAPSYRMIRQSLGIRTDGEVRRIIVALVDAGAIKRVGAGKVRRIRMA